MSAEVESLAGALRAANTPPGIDDENYWLSEAEQILASDWIKAHDADVAAAALRDAADHEDFAVTCDHLPWVRLGGLCQCGWLRARADEGNPR